MNQRSETRNQRSEVRGLKSEHNQGYQYQIWVATSDDVPGLATEGNDLEALIEKLKVMIPELLDANGISREYEVPFEILTRSFETAHLQAVNV